MKGLVENSFYWAMEVSEKPRISILLLLRTKINWSSFFFLTDLLIHNYFQFKVGQKSSNKYLK